MNGSVEVVFSRNIYQIGLKSGQWVFLRLGEDGKPLDSFCSCNVDDCAHCKKALAFITEGEPIHERFQRSGYYQLLFDLASHHSFRLPEEPFFHIEDKELLKQIKEPPSEFKFSALSEEEATFWQQGRPSPEVAFELSPYSDIAKHFFLKAKPFKITGDRLTMGKEWIEVPGLAQVSFVEEKRVLPKTWSLKESALVVDGKRYEGQELSDLLTAQATLLKRIGVPIFTEKAPLTLDWEGDRLKIVEPIAGDWVITEKGFYPRPEWLVSPFIDAETIDSVMEALPNVHWNVPLWPVSWRMIGETIHFEAVGQRVKVLGNWLQTSEGFFPRVAAGKRTLIGTSVSFDELPGFARDNEELLTQVDDFWLNEPPYSSVGWKLLWDGTHVQVVPEITTNLPFKRMKDLLYVPGKGFWRLEEEVPEAHDLPLETFVADPERFLAKATWFDPALTPITDVKAVVDGDQMFYLVNGVRIPARFLKDKTVFFTEGGWINVQQPRFEWLKWWSGGALNALDRLRLQALEGITFELPKTEAPHIEGLRSWQEVGLTWLWNLSQMGLSALLCDDMGLGKTHQAMALMKALHSTGKKRFCILCPTSVLHHWKDRLAMFAPELTVNLYHNAARSLDDSQVLLTSYGVLRSDLKAIKKKSFDLIIFDEVQLAKNRSSQTWSSLAALKGTFRLGLTGTPIENHIGELKSLMELVLPGLIPPHFKAEEHQELLQKLTAPLILRRTKEELLDELPAKTEEILWSELTDQQRELYKALLERRKPLLDQIREEGVANHYLSLLSMIIQLKKICNHPALYLKQIDEWEKWTSSKWEQFTDLVDEAIASGQKVVVFSHFLGMLDIIEQWLHKRHIGFARLRGSTMDRSEQIRHFHEKESCKVFVASLQAAGLGVDLTPASVVIHYDRWWNPSKENQATDRVHRMGQTRGVQVFKLATIGTVEENIDRLISKKKELFDKLFSQRGNPDYQALSSQDWLQILSLVHE